jgi:signal transduction histidine kinase/CheY-like chemotaxis protein
LTLPDHDVSSRALILAPQGRDATIASGILFEAGIPSSVCSDLSRFVEDLIIGAGVAVVTDEAIRNEDLNELAGWIASQPSWSDFPFVLLTERGGGLERNPTASRQMEALGNVAFLERPFHPMTFVSVVKTALRGRQRQYEARGRMEELHRSERHAWQAEVDLRRLNETLEGRVAERTQELGAANKQLVSQIEERERVEATLRKMQRLEAVGQLTSGVAHDFNNLLTVVLGNLTFVEKGINAADSGLKQRLSYMRLAAERGAKLTAQLLAFSRAQRLEPKPINLNDALANMRDLLQSSLGGGVQINTLFGPQLWYAFADPAQIELVVLNLAINARDAMEVGGSVTLETANVAVTASGNPEEPGPGEYVVISVADTGMGMAKEVLAKACEPFFTTKQLGRGSGLGLSQVLGFAKQSGGGIRIDSRQGEGTTVKVFLPRAQMDDGLETAHNSIPEAPAHRRAEIILLVDDDNAVREVTALILRDLGYTVLEVGSGGAALEVLSGEAHVDLVVLDFAMPGMNGIEVARQVQARFPSLPVLFVTGYADKDALSGVSEGQIVRKPFVGEELANKVGASLASRTWPSAKIIPLDDGAREPATASAQRPRQKGPCSGPDSRASRARS